MSLIRLALRRPVTVLVACAALALAAVLAVTRLPADIFPDLKLPVIYVAQPYGGLDPAQMEGYVTSYYEYHFLYIAGIEHVESKSVQNTALIKLAFHPGTDMSQALAQTVAYVERSRAFMPPGTVPPFVVRFDAGSVPVAQLVFSSPTRSVGEIQDLALFRVRPLFATLPGVSAPPPFGASQRTIVVRVHPERLRAYALTPEAVIEAVARGNAILPAGNVRTGDLNRIARVNSVVEAVSELNRLPLRAGAGPAVFLRDVGSVEDASDILTSYALVDGRRTVYIPVTKRADASTLDVVKRVREALPRMQAALPADVQLSLAFDQSVIVSRALRNVAVEAALGAALTGLVVLLFLRDPRSAAIVVTTIPLALLASLVALWLTGETINLMTLGGLALAVGILVDEATVAIENIHVHRARGKPLRRAVLEATSETVTPRLLAMLSILAVFVPSFFMVGVTRALFVPLSLAVGFAMLASYLLSNTLVPVLSAWFLREHAAPRRPPSLGRLLERYRRTVRFLIRWRWPVVGAYAAVSAAVLVLLVPALGRDLFPPMEAGQLALRIRAPTGTRVERTEALTKDVLQAIREEAGPENVARTLAFVGIAPSSYPINAIHLWSSGTHEAVMQVALQAGAPFTVPELQERLRAALPRRFPGLSLTFEPGDVVSQILNFGAPAPIEVALSGPDLSANRIFAASVLRELRGVAELRDLGYEQPLDYPTLDLRVDRERAGQLGVTVADVGRSLVAATSSSRFVQPNYWRDPKSGVAYQVQVEMPESSMQSPEAVAAVAVGAGPRPALLDDLAEVRFGSMPGEYDRYNMQRMISISANLAPGWDLGRATAQVSAALVRAGEPPRGVSVQVRGQVPSLQSTTSGLLLGLGIGVVAIFLLLSAYFESLRIGVVALAVFPGVGAGVAAALLATGTSLNVQSFMGAIMALGVSAANAILLVTFAEATRRRGADAAAAAETGATSRIRPVLMTTLAMIAGMIPLALGIGEGGEQTASLARAVIGGLAASTATTLLVLPAVFALVQRWTSTGSRSLLPDDSLPTAPREQ